MGSVKLFIEFSFFGGGTGRVVVMMLGSKPGPIPCLAGASQLSYTSSSISSNLVEGKIGDWKILRRKAGQPEFIL